MISEYEGYPIQEAVLTYAARQNLPSSAFCGPERTYPANDSKSIRVSFNRLSLFGKKIPKSIAVKVYCSLIRKAKRFGVEYNPEKFNWLTGKKTIEETFQEDKKRTKMLLSFLDEEYGLKK